MSGNLFYFKYVRQIYVQNQIYVKKNHIAPTPYNSYSPPESVTNMDTCQIL